MFLWFPRHFVTCCWTVVAVLHVTLISPTTAENSNGNVDVDVDAADDQQLIKSMIDWAKSNGALIHENIETRQIEGELSGIFAKADIPAGTVISEIPWNLILQAKAPPSSKDTDDDERLWCETVWTVYESITKPWESDENENEYTSTTVATPYEKYLSKRTSRKYYPAFWSQAGRDAFRDLLGKAMPTFNSHSMLHGWWYRECFNYQPRNYDTIGNVPMNDERVLDALYLVMTRAEGVDANHMIPFHDLINHRNGDQYINTEAVRNDEQNYQLVTTRLIRKGEQLQESYNQCRWCKIYTNPDHERGYIVTPQLYEQYGFIESYPQRWVVPGVRLLFDIEEEEDREDEKEDDTTTVAKTTTTKRRHVNFVFPPSEKATAFLLKEIVRLANFEATYGQYEEKETDSPIPAHEMDAIWNLHESILSAFTLAYGSATGQTSEDVWDLGEYWYWEGELPEDDDDSSEL